MIEAMSWFVAVAVLLIMELFTGTFYLLMIALGVAAGGIATLAGAGQPAPAVIAAVVGVLATLLLRSSKYGKREKTDPRHDPNINLDIGQRITVNLWVDGAARVMYRGALWDVELAPGAKPESGSFTIREIRGSRLIVS